ncbi:uncharacterized protein [Primulina huaijiensis]|uniref:uncharacterized protein n=1 Tax=Primulina huaijiensis TaxID=1492673 RepID=UPI003CC78B56
MINEDETINPTLIHKPHISWSDSYAKAQAAIASLSSILPSVPSSIASSESPVTSLLHDPNVAAHITQLLHHPDSGAGDDNLCRWLYDTFQSAQPELHLVVLRFIPVLAGVYLSGASLNKPLPGFEAVLLAIYSYETAARNGQQVTVSIPDISLSSIYHETKQTDKNGATELHIALVSPSLEPHGTVRSTRRAKIVGVALELYYNKISYMPIDSKIDFCKLCMIWSGHQEESGIINLEASSSSQVKDGNVEILENICRNRKQGRITLPWEILHPVLRILGHCLMGPGKDKRLSEAAYAACNCLYARSLHDINSKAIMATGSLLKVAKMVVDSKDEIDHTEIPMSNVITL